MGEAIPQKGIPGEEIKNIFPEIEAPHAISRPGARRASNIQRTVSPRKCGETPEAGVRKGQKIKDLAEFDLVSSWEPVEYFKSCCGFQEESNVQKYKNGGNSSPRLPAESAAVAFTGIPFRTEARSGRKGPGHGDGCGQQK